MHRAPTVSDSLWFESLPIEQQEAVKRLFGVGNTGQNLLDNAYARGHRTGVAMGHLEMLHEIRKCPTCSGGGVRWCAKHGGK